MPNRTAASLNFFTFQSIHSAPTVFHFSFVYRLVVYGPFGNKAHGCSVHHTGHSISLNHNYSGATMLRKHRFSTFELSIFQCDEKANNKKNIHLHTHTHTHTRQQVHPSQNTATIYRTAPHKRTNRKYVPPLRWRQHTGESFLFRRANLWRGRKVHALSRTIAFFFNTKQSTYVHAKETQNVCWA